MNGGITLAASSQILGAVSGAVAIVGALVTIVYFILGMRRWRSHPPGPHPFRLWLVDGFSRNSRRFDACSGFHLILDGIFCLLCTIAMVVLYFHSR